MKPIGVPSRRSTSTGRASRRFARLALVALAFVLAVAACGRQDDPPVVPSAVDLVADRPVAAARVDVRYDPADARFVDAIAVASEVLVRAYELSPGRVRVAWVSTVEDDGTQVRLRFAGDVSGVVADVVEPYRSDGTALPDGSVAATSLDVAGDDAFAGASGPSLEPLAHVGDHLPDLRPEFAAYPLGDMDRSGGIDVLDVLAVLDAVVVMTLDDYGLYHSDLDGDASTGLPDVLRLLDKVVNPDLPAMPVVKPGYVTFLQMLEDVPVLVGNAGSVPFPWIDLSLPAGVQATQQAGVSGQAAAFALSIPAAQRPGWLPGVLTVDTGTDDEPEVRVGSFVLLVAGQSNASGRGLPIDYPGPEPLSEVRMFANDYQWKIAEEPLDDPTGQVDTCSGSCEDESARYSFGTALGRNLWEATGSYTYLIPSAHGGTKTALWLPGADRENRSTLFGSSTFRAKVSAALRDNPVEPEASGSEGGPVSVIVWFQGESDANLAGDRQDYLSNTDDIMDAYVDELDVPIVYVQLAANSSEQQNLEQTDIAEKQRRLETASGEAEARQRFYMVVANDLPLSDLTTEATRGIHVSALGHTILAERIALAVREHVLGEPVDGTGPRLENLTYQGTTVWVDLDVPVTSDVANDEYAGFFTVFDGAPTGDLDDHANYGDNAVPVADAYRDPNDPSRVVLELAPFGGSLSSAPHVRYAPPPYRGWKTSADWQRVVENVIRGVDSDLPLPTFGPLQATLR